MARAEHRPRDPGDVPEPSAACAAPIGFGRCAALQAVEREFARLAELGGVGAQDAILAWEKGDGDMAIDRHRQDEPVVVVGVLADEVDSAGGGRDARAFAAGKDLLEFVPGTEKETLADHVVRARAQALAAQLSRRLGQPEANKNGESLEAFPVLFPERLKPEPGAQSRERAYCCGLCSTSCTGSFFFEPSPLIWMVGSAGASLRTCWR